MTLSNIGVNLHYGYRKGLQPQRSIRARVLLPSPVQPSKASGIVTPVVNSSPVTARLSRERIRAAVHAALR